MTGNDWGDTLPSDVIHAAPQAVPGTRVDDKTLHCQGCLRTVPDNSAPGLKPSCPHCWAPIEVVP